VVSTLKALPEIRAVHDIHIWSISSNLRAMSTHVVVDELLRERVGGLAASYRGCGKGRFGITHTTVQIECGQCGKDDSSATYRMMIITMPGS